jgi:hypothetical protein
VPPANPGRPPAARLGQPLAYAGRPVVAGVGNFAHPVSARASVADIWSTLEIAAASGETALQRSGAPRLDAKAQTRLRAYVSQSKQYYEAVATADPIAKPLLGYYFTLNAAKAFLTAKDSAVTSTLRLVHGISDDTSGITDPYDFYQEQFKVQASGVFQSLASSTGRRFAWVSGLGAMRVSKLVPYLVEGVDLFSSSFSPLRSALVPVDRIVVRGGGKRPNREAWLVVEVSKLALEEAGLSARKLLSDAAAFAASFDLVDDGNPSTATYELKTPINYAQMPGALGGLSSAFDHSLISRNRSLPGRRDFITVSPHLDLVSSEALTFATMLHLSNMVRYRPHHVEALRGTGHWWLFTSWVDRACENFLLSMSSRLSLEEHLIG